MTTSVINSNLIIIDEVTGSHHGQVDGLVKIGNPNTDEVYGLLSYSIHGNKLHINMVEVSPEYQRKGYATYMVNYLKRANRKQNTNWGFTTVEGTKFKKHVERKSIHKVNTRKGTQRRKT
jgi:ribosomal protein S18 acetylase RimI-like enzyme